MAGFLAGDDPAEAWALTADELGWRVLAEACDGARPLALVEALVAASGTVGEVSNRAHLRRWLEQAQECEAPGLEEEAAPWLEQARIEASICLLALQALEAADPAAAVPPEAADPAAAVPPEAADPAAATESLLAAAAVWQGARRGPASVFGPRAGLRPVLSQDPAGRWCFHASSLDLDVNATDRLLRHVAAACDAGPVRAPGPP